MNAVKKNQITFKIALLSISLLLTTSGSIASAVTKMQETFSNHSATAVEALVTASNITVMIFVLLSAFLVRVLGTKKTVLLGILLAGIGGVVPFFSDNYTLVYASRLVLGAGLGMFNSLAVSLINEFYSGDTRNKMLGYQAAVQSLGQTLTTFVAGILVNYNWHYAFAIYFLAAVSFVLFLVYVPDVKPEEEQSASEEKVSTKQSVNSFVILQTLVLMLSFVLLMAVSLKASALVQEHNMANPGFLGTALSVQTLVSFLASFFYGNIVKYTKQFTLAICYIVLGVGHIMLSFATNMAMLTVVLAVAGAGSAMFLPYSFGIIMERAPKNSANLAVSISMVGTNLGCVLSPYILAFIGSTFNNTSASFSLLACGFIFVLLAVVYLFLSKSLKNDSKDLESMVEMEEAME
ncbi:MFS transporter [Enterococcus sp. HY326]|uniref:MFS transporter n=1 Tax=Enterococcus sp. HY326 TaxID=2971265 RepID=UPI002240584A|nr:MFS transporter [Enterococcus sp. HY326]